MADNAHTPNLHHADTLVGLGDLSAYTVRRVADILNMRPDTATTRVRRKLGKGFGLDSVLSLEQVREAFGNVVPAEPEVQPEAQPTPQPEPDQHAPQVEVSQEQDDIGWRTELLYLLMAVPAIASVQNIYAVTHDLTDDVWASGLLTVLFTASPFLFVLAGMRSAWTQLLTIALILYEVFANFTRIYGGLTGFGRAWKVAVTARKWPLSNEYHIAEGPFCTRFLNLICDIFHTRHDYTAIVMAAIMAALAASVFYAAYNELKK